MRGGIAFVLHGLPVSIWPASGFLVFLVIVRGNRRPLVATCCRMCGHDLSVHLVVFGVCSGGVLVMVVMYPDDAIRCDSHVSGSLSSYFKC